MHLFCPSHSKSHHQLKTEFPASVTLLFQSLPYKHGLQGLCSGKASTCGGHLAWPLASLAFIQVILLGLSFSYKLTSYRPSHAHSSPPKSIILAPGSREANAASLLVTLAHILERLSFLLVEKAGSRNSQRRLGSELGTHWECEAVVHMIKEQERIAVWNQEQLEPPRPTSPFNLLLPSRTCV